MHKMFQLTIVSLFSNGKTNYFSYYLKGDLNLVSIGDTVSYKNFSSAKQDTKKQT